QGVPGAGAQAAPPARATVRHRARARDQVRRPRGPDLRGPDHLPRPHLRRGQEDRLARRRGRPLADLRLPPSRVSAEGEIAVNAAIVGDRPTGLGLYALHIIRTLAALGERLVVYTSRPDVIAAPGVRIERVPAAVRP